MAKRTIKLNIKLPAGVHATSKLEAKALAAAKAVIESEASVYQEAQKLAKQLSAKGIQITAEELIMRKTSGKRSASKKASGKKAVRKRVVLSEAKRKTLISDIKKGEKTPALAAKYGVSTATVMNIKAAAGLTKKRK
ncbi:MAG: hypothetical protein ACON39_05970 [Coraliomargaritaceae bacterium]